MYNELIDDLIEALRPIEVTGDAATSMCLAMELSEAKAEIEQLKRERDAITALINQKAFKPIEECAKYDKCYAEAAKQGKMLPCITCNSWQWRGVKEDTANG